MTRASEPRCSPGLRSPGQDRAAWRRKTELSAGVGPHDAVDSLGLAGEFDWVGGKRLNILVLFDAVDKDPTINGKRRNVYGDVVVLAPNRELSFVLQ